MYMGTISFVELLDVRQVAEELGISENTVRLYCQGGRLGTKVGQQWIITRAELEAFKKKPRKPGRPRKKDTDPTQSDD